MMLWMMVVASCSLCVVRADDGVDDDLFSKRSLCLLVVGGSDADGIDVLLVEVC